MQNALKEFDGTLIIVSHDVDFLKPITTKVIEFKNKNIREYYGDIEYYLTKSEENESENNSSIEKSAISTKINRKTEKRIEAEKRQKEYKATKLLKERISFLETTIEDLEKEKELLQLDFTKSEIYSDSQKAKSNRQSYEKVIKELDKKYEEWSVVSEELEEIQIQFNQNDSL